MLSQGGRDVLLVLLALLVTVGIAFGAPAWSMVGHGASLSAFSRIRPGMTREQVVAILGRPATSNHGPGGSESMYYTRWTWCQVKVRLSADGIVTETDHDH